MSVVEHSHNIWRGKLVSNFRMIVHHVIDLLPSNQFKETLGAINWEDEDAT